MKLHLSKTDQQSTPSGVTLIELTVVITVILLLVGVSIYSIAGFKEWKLAVKAGTTLRTVHTAQSIYLAEHPMEAFSTLTAAKILPYMSDGSTALPTVEDLDGNQLTIKVNVFPPVIDDGSGGTYDPSGDLTDGQWDVGD